MLCEARRLHSSVVLGGESQVNAEANEPRQGRETNRQFEALSLGQWKRSLPGLRRVWLTPGYYIPAFQPERVGRAAEMAHFGITLWEILPAPTVLRRRACIGGMLYRVQLPGMAGPKNWRG